MSNPDIDNSAKLEELIHRAAEHLEGLEEESTDYNETLDRYERLNKIKKSLTPDPTPVVVQESADKDRVRLKDFIPVIGSVGGILVIVVFEAFGHTLTSKATQFLPKSK